MDEVLYVRELWLKRAEVAQECADELEGLASSLDGVARRNYLGLGCVEGVRLFETLSRVIDAGVESLTLARGSAVMLSGLSLSASEGIPQADAEGSGAYGE